MANIERFGVEKHSRGVTVRGRRNDSGGAGATSRASRAKRHDAFAPRSAREWTRVSRDEGTFTDANQRLAPATTVGLTGDKAGRSQKLRDTVQRDVPSHQHRILVVEDERDLREVMFSLLENEGWQVATAENGREGLDYLRSQPPPCLVILDLMMPVMSGWEFLQEKEADAALVDIPVVVTTAIGKDAAEGLAPRPVLFKPVAFKRLCELISRYCSNGSPGAAKP